MKTLLNKSDRWFAIGAFLVSASCLYAGWCLFWFLTDDAHISFRYVSNAQLGFGYVWNAPPFRPVEGYTNFLWVVLLDVVWKVSGFEPPQSSNILSLVFSAVTVALTIAMALKLAWPERRKPVRHALVALMLVTLLANRTFLTWTSSGLETAMFNTWITLWIYIALFTRKDRFAWPLGLSLATSLIYLTRPDGLLFCAVTLLLLRGNVSLKPTSRVLASLPLLAVPIHLVWRKTFYGAWLPNTYYAKATDLWPESGVRYFASFLLEYGLWLWILLGVLTLRHLLGGIAAVARDRSISQLIRQFVLESPGVLVVLTLIAHLAYYTLVVGGDHFEYRVYSHLVPLLGVGLLWMLNQHTYSNGKAIILAVVFLSLSLPIPWTHWQRSQPHRTRETTYMMKVSVAEAWPPGTRWYATAFDRLQSWLIDRHVCTRRQEHKVFWLEQSRAYPSRSIGQTYRFPGYPAIAVRSVGVAGWMLPHVNILDMHGLNDYVTARSPIPENSKVRLMAHEHYPPAAYMKSFRPNVRVVDWGQIAHEPRDPPLTAGDIRRIESEWARRVDRR
jgi:arabinofuranosyltransferase